MQLRLQGFQGRRSPPGLDRPWTAVFAKRIRVVGSWRLASAICSLCGLHGLEQRQSWGWSVSPFDSVGNGPQAHPSVPRARSYNAHTPRLARLSMGIEEKGSLLAHSRRRWYPL